MANSLDAFEAHERVIALMRKQLDNMDVREVDKQATKKKLVDEELKRVQKATRQAARDAMGADPRQAYKAVRATKYKRIFGGNINILTPRKGNMYLMNPDSLYSRTRNRFRSARTINVQSYAGASRSFVLRFIEGGTVKRTAGTKYSNRGGHGNRGMITAKHFMATAQSQMATAPDRLGKQLEIIIEKQFEA